MNGEKYSDWSIYEFREPYFIDISSRDVIKGRLNTETSPQNF